MSARIFFWVANWNLSRAQAQVLLGAGAVEMVDCPGGDLPKVLAAWPDHNQPLGVRRFAGYVTGSPDIAWTAAQFAEVHARGGVALKIDQSDAADPLRADVKVAKDVETGASTIPTAVITVRDRFADALDSCIYIEQSELVNMEDALEAAGLPRGQIIGYQYASPLHTPSTPLPGTQGHVTIGEVNCDLSLILEDFLPLPAATYPPVAEDADVKTARVAVPELGIEVDLSYDPRTGHAALLGWTT